MTEPVKIAILAMGGQGGGQLADWIVAAAERAGWQAQSTSVPGVAQRTGATLYYIETMQAEPGREPVFALMPAPYDCDIVLACEMMEAGRALLRGLCSPQKTTVIASTHRSLAVAEKEMPGAGAGSPAAVNEALGLAARRTIAFDMEKLAKETGSYISAAMLGALAGAKVLPFDVASFERVIAGRGAEKSLRAFHAAALLPKDYPDAKSAQQSALARVIAFQDEAYGREFQELVAPFAALGLGEFAAKAIARAMAYDDVIAVARAKTAPERITRIESEFAGALVSTTEYMQPGVAEIAGLMPPALGTWIERHPGVFEALFGGPRRVRSQTVHWFLVLKFIAGLRRFRRGMLRHQREMQSIRDWHGAALDAAKTDRALGAAVLSARKLMKGYSGTQTRTSAKYEKVMAALPLLTPRADGAAWMERLILAAEKDENGDALDGALKTVRGLA